MEKLRIQNADQSDFQNIYNQVLKLIKSGMTIYKACDTAKTTSSRLYRNMTKEQKQELRFYKAVLSTHGVAGHCLKKESINIDTEDTDVED